jgi:hypothetical protein
MYLFISPALLMAIRESKMSWGRMVQVCGVGRDTLNRWVQGAAVPAAKRWNVERLAAALGLPVTQALSVR